MAEVATQILSKMECTLRGTPHYPDDTEINCTTQQSHHDNNTDESRSKKPKANTAELVSLFRTSTIAGDVGTKDEDAMISPAGKAPPSLTRSISPTDSYEKSPVTPSRGPHAGLVEDRDARKKRKRSPEEDRRRLKCPYYLHKPERHRKGSCRGEGFADMGKLK